MNLEFRHILPVALAFIATSAIADNPSNPEIETVTIGGSFLTSRIDANGDGEASSWCTIQIKGGYKGSSMMQCVNEDVFTGVTADCPGGEYVVNGTYGGTGTGVRTFPSGSDQLYVVLVERYLCADLTGHVTEGRDNGVIIGGSGRYAGATGTYEWDYTGQILYADPAAQPPQFFGSLTGTGLWVINLAED